MKQLYRGLKAFTENSIKYICIITMTMTNDVCYAQTIYYKEVKY